MANMCSLDEQSCDGGAVGQISSLFVRHIEERATVGMPPCGDAVYLHSVLQLWAHLKQGRLVLWGIAVLWRARDILQIQSQPVGEIAQAHKRIRRLCSCWPKVPNDILICLGEILVSCHELGHLVAGRWEGEQWSLRDDAGACFDLLRSEEAFVLVILVVAHAG
jgi:hypothetical protein